MSEIVHITFEKLTGLKGTIEGDFIATNFGLWSPMVDTSLPVIFLTDGPLDDSKGQLFFRQGEKYFLLKALFMNCNYREHFTSGTNFLIKEWSYGRGAGYNKGISQSLN